MKLEFSSSGKSWSIELTHQAPRSCRALLDILPIHAQLHTPKIAGSHIYWHVPFIMDVEGATDVLDTKAGAFIYWPVRQFLEITFAPLQAEKAQVSVLGQLDADIEGIAELADSVKKNQGHHIITASLKLSSSASGSAASDHNLQQKVPAPCLLPDDLITCRKELWLKMPDDISQLPKSRAIMHPLGPVFTAESQARICHEFLWWVRSHRHSMTEDALRQSAALALNKAATILQDFCHLQQSSALLFRLEQLMAEKYPFQPLLDEAILIVGRISAWLDLLIPWHDLNEAFRGEAFLEGKIGEEK